MLENNVIEHPLPFDIFGLGQPTADGAFQIQGNGENDWDPWPDQGQDVNQQPKDIQAVAAEELEQNDGQIEEPAGQGQEQIGEAEEFQVNLNEAPDAIQDLNQPPIDLDLDPVIINLGENDHFGQGEQIQYLLQGQGEVYLLNPNLEEPVDVNLELALHILENVVDQEIHDAQAGANENIVPPLAAEHVIINEQELAPVQQEAIGNAEYNLNEGSPNNYLVDEFSSNQLMNSADFLANSSENVESHQQPMEGSQHSSSSRVQQELQAQIQIFGPPLQEGQMN